MSTKNGFLWDFKIMPNFSKAVTIVFAVPEESLSQTWILRIHNKDAFYINAFNSTIEPISISKVIPTKKIEETVLRTTSGTGITVQPLAISTSKVDDKQGLMAMLFLLIITAIYLIPWVISVLNKHPAKVGILALNLLLGWTFVRWIIALVWAVTKPQPPQQVIINQTPPPKE